MQKKAIKYTASVILLMIVAYHSVYFKKLDEVKAGSLKSFDAPLYARNYYNNKLVPNLDKAVEITTLIELIKKDRDKAFKQYSNALGIGNIRYFLVKGEGTVTAIDENAVTMTVQNDSSKKEIKIATEFIYGNAIRDASGLIDMNDFNTTIDFNNVSAEINKIVRKEVVPPFKLSAKLGDRVLFSGALELNQAHINLEGIEVIPISLSIVK